LLNHRGDRKVPPFFCAFGREVDRPVTLLQLLGANLTLALESAVLSITVWLVGLVLANRNTSVTGALLHPVFHGPVWLTGGSAGPEGSILVLPLLVLVVLGTHFAFPVRKQP
jgi:hypothetical protein